MAENSFKALLITFILVGVFIIALANVGIKIGTNNNSSISILDNDALNRTFGGLQSDLENAEVTVNASTTSFETEKTSVEFGELNFKSIVGSGKKFAGILKGVVSLIFGFIFSIFPFPIVIGAIFTLLTVSILFFLWRLIKQGE